MDECSRENPKQEDEESEIHEVSRSEQVRAQETMFPRRVLPVWFLRPRTIQQLCDLQSCMADVHPHELPRELPTGRRGNSAPGDASGPLIM